MLGDSAVLGGGGEGGGGDAVASASAVAAAHEGGADTAVGGGGGSISGDEERGRGEEGDRSFGGNRWPRQETLALLKIRSDMDVAFRDASVKSPLWEEISRKLAELGYHRNAKKCKEKFENVYKYHKRTKEGRSGKSDGKTYKFFDQLQALEVNHPAITIHQSSTPSQTTAPLQVTPVSIVVTAASLSHTIPTTTTVPMISSSNTTTPSSVNIFPFSHATLPISMPQPILNTTITTTPSINLTIPSFPPPTNPTYIPPSSTPNPTSKTPHITPISFPSIPMDLLSNYSSSSTSSDETLEGRRKRKRKWKDFFERLMKEMIEKQEELQWRFLEAIEKREQERYSREEAWRMQEIQRINREREILAQERSMTAAKDAAVMAFLQKIAEQQNLGQALNNITIPQQHVPPATASPPVPALPAPIQVQQQTPFTQAESVPMPAAQTQMQPAGSVVSLAPQQQPQVSNMEIVKADNGENMTGTSSSRWPKVEVLALIRLRTSLDAKYQENGPKGPLWEEISSLMRNNGYNRSAKRCKEKWENINKYFKKVKESSKKRPEDSKTCPYFHELDALYRERNKLQNPMKHESMMAPLMVQPEQQWPPQQPPTAPPQNVTMEDAQNDPMDHRHHEEEDEDDKDMDDEDEDEDEDEGGGDNYEIVASKPS
ncbi:hypothetical protein Lal_00028599 [Lupinus albus]|uniref:Putative transcription factor MYB-HB-like family n=1 Tax=Lupinus albus TaxID=3870 RepID=A0A6A4NSY5_LUPAL|nr:putative transcription factor MYB-HB-like family [Lupinus albus]KAF1884713.1 hypothetical protein Lal_00028599 [Lupinus albus]